MKLLVSTVAVALSVVSAMAAPLVSPEEHHVVRADERHMIVPSFEHSMALPFDERYLSTMKAVADAAEKAAKEAMDAAEEAAKAAVDAADKAARAIAEDSKAATAARKAASEAAEAFGDASDEHHIDRRWLWSWTKEKARQAAAAAARAAKEAMDKAKAAADATRAAAARALQVAADKAIEAAAASARYAQAVADAAARAAAEVADQAKAVADAAARALKAAADKAKEVTEGLGIVVEAVRSAATDSLTRCFNDNIHPTSMLTDVGACLAQAASDGAATAAIVTLEAYGNLLSNYGVFNDRYVEYRGNLVVVPDYQELGTGVLSICELEIYDKEHQQVNLMKDQVSMTHAYFNTEAYQAIDGDTDQTWKVTNGRGNCILTDVRDKSARPVFSAQLDTLPHQIAIYHRVSDNEDVAKRSKVKATWKGKYKTHNRESDMEVEFRHVSGTHSPHWYRSVMTPSMSAIALASVGASATVDIYAFAADNDEEWYKPNARSRSPLPNKDHPFRKMRIGWAGDEVYYGESAAGFKIVLFSGSDGVEWVTNIACSQGGCQSEKFAEDVDASLPAEYRESDVVIVGHSRGNFLASVYCHLYPSNMGHYAAMMSTGMLADPTVGAFTVRVESEGDWVADLDSPMEADDFYIKLPSATHNYDEYRDEIQIMMGNIRSTKLLMDDSRRKYT